MNFTYTDTRRFENHREWCGYLAARNMLTEKHRGCVRHDHCVAPHDNAVARRKAGEVIPWKVADR